MDGSQEFIVDLGQPILFDMIHISNMCWTGYHHKFFGQVEIRISNDGTPWSLDASAYVIPNIYEGGFFVVQLSTPARYIAIRRIGPNPSNGSDNQFFVSELRVFQNSNLLSTLDANIMMD